MTKMLLVNVDSSSQWTMLRQLVRRFDRSEVRCVVCCREDAPDALLKQLHEDTPSFCGDLIIASVPKGPEAKVAPRERTGLFEKWQVDWHTERPLFKASFCNLLSEINGAKAVLNQTSPDLVIVAEDGLGGNASIVRIAAEMGVPVLNIPYEYSGREDFEAALFEAELRGSLNKLSSDPCGALVKELAPQWVLDMALGEVMMYPGDYIRAREAVGLGIPNPWAVHGGLASRLAAESDAMATHYVAEGVDASKIITTGSVYADIIYAELEKAELRQAFESGNPISDKRFKVLLSLPPSYHETRPGQSEFPSYLEMCTRLIETVAEFADATVSIHPATPQSERNSLMKLPANISDEYIISLIPQHDVFITGFSSTIRWAIASGKLVLNYDMYKYGLKCYDSVPGFKNTQQLKTLKQWLREATSSAGSYKEMTAQQRSVAELWGTLDGYNCNRISALIDEMVRTKAAYPLSKRDAVHTQSAGIMPTFVHRPLALLRRAARRFL